MTLELDPLVGLEEAILAKQTGGLEPCLGCGDVAEAHPMVAVCAIPPDNTFDAFGVCARCHADPSHRTRTIKGHYFTRREAASAVSAAGATELTTP